VACIVPKISGLIRGNFSRNSARRMGGANGSGLRSAHQSQFMTLMGFAWLNPSYGLSGELSALSR
jgi:hypothetical protein